MYYIFIGTLVYYVNTGGLWWIWVCTRNDHHKRVRWHVGTALRERWMREDERAALDKVACAWGYRVPQRWGEERGEEWELLKEYCGRKGLVIDDPEAMSEVMEPDSR